MTAVHLHDPLAFAGRVEHRTIESNVLRGNPLGDPYLRDVPVYVPPGSHGPLPVIYLLAGFTGRGASMLETHPWKRGVIVRYDQAVANGAAPPALLVLPDCFTAMGGSQYVNSSAIGRYEDHLADEILPFVDEHYDTRSGARAVGGKSSGGFGALHLVMRRPGLFQAAGSISGDCHFEYGYAHDFLPAVRGLELSGLTPRAYLDAFLKKPDLSGDGHAVINLMAMSACYSPNPDSELGFDLPVDLRTGERLQAVWSRWLTFDPVVIAEVYGDALRKLKWLYISAGKSDEFQLQFSARILARRLDKLGVPHEHEEFEGGHFGLDDRYLDLIPRLVGALDS